MNLKNKTIKGLKWSSIAQGGKQIFQIVITVILSRLLTPDDFGILGMATVFIGFVTIFGEMGVSSAIIQKQDVTEMHLSSAFWLNIFAGVILTFIFWIVAPLIAVFYDNPKLVRVLEILSLNFTIAAFTVIQQAVLMKEMDFKALAIRDFVAVIASGIIGISFAYAGFGVWALVYQFLTFTVFNSIILWIFSKWRPKAVFSFCAIKDIFQFSANMTGFRVLNYFARNVDYLLIGKFLGAEALGYYTLAYKLMLIPLRNISEVIGKVMFPAFSKIQDDLEKVRSAYQRMIKAISLVTFPMMFGLFAITPELVIVIFGPQWEPVIILLRIFCFCGMFQSIGTTVGNILLSQGRAYLQLKLQIVGTAIVVASVLIGLQWGVNGVAFCYTVQAIIWTVVGFIITNKIVLLTNTKLLKQVTYSLVMSFIMANVLFVCKLFMSITGFYKIGVLVFIGVLSYGFCCFLFKEVKFTNNKRLQFSFLH